MSRLLATFAVIWRLAHPYFFSEDRRAGRILLAGVILIELSLVGINVMINRWQNRFYNALQDRAWDAFVNAVDVLRAAGGSLCGAGGLSALPAAVAADPLARLDDAPLSRPLAGRLQSLPDAASRRRRRQPRPAHRRGHQAVRREGDPDRRCGCSAPTVSFVSFVVILWGLSADAPLQLFGYEVSIPGYLVWAALIYADHRHRGDPLDRQAADQSQFPAAALRSRFPLQSRARARELRADRIAARARPRRTRACSTGSPSSSTTGGRSCRGLKRLTLLTASYRQISAVFPFILVSPAYFAGQDPARRPDADRERLRQRAGGALDLHRRLSRPGGMARGRRPARRLRRRDRAGAGHRRGQARHRRSRRATTAVAIAIGDLMVRLPNGKPLVAAETLEIEPGGDSVLVTGPSGAGKSTLFRAIAGIWPFGSGAIRVPAGARVMVMPQRPYFPVATLAAAVSYPDAPGTFDSAQLAEATDRGRTAAPGRAPGRGGALEPRAVAGRAAAARPSRARSCRSRTSCSSTRPPRRSTKPRKRRCTSCSRPGLPARPWFRSGTAPRWPVSMTGIWCWCARPTAPAARASGGSGSSSELPLPPPRRPGFAAHEVVPKPCEGREQQRADRHRRDEKAPRHVLRHHDQRIDSGRRMKGAGGVHGRPSPARPPAPPPMVTRR